MLHVSWIPIQDWGRHSIYIYILSYTIYIYSISAIGSGASEHPMVYELRHDVPRQLFNKWTGHGVDDMLVGIL
jgi:hypothetical protein